MKENDLSTQLIWKYLFSDRIEKVHKSFIREILKVTENPKIISFAGGLPNPTFFPINEISNAASKVLENDGENVLQYSTTEGYYPLREYIAKRYLKKRLKIDPDDILITNGSQQGLDLLGKIFINNGDKIIIEKPGYLGAIQAFSMYEPIFYPIPLTGEGMDTSLLENTLKNNRIKLIYSVINFQNPSGITYSKKIRTEIGNILKDNDTIFIEDDAYGELRFIGKDIPSMKYYNDNVIMLGSFSKITSPGLRLGWICAKKEVMNKLIVAKQASDLHSNYFSQRILYQYLIDNNIDIHIEIMKNIYKKQRDLMVSMIEEYFPKDIEYTKPEGGMFLWITLPKRISSRYLFDCAIEENVAFVPGDPFYTDGEGKNTLRLNFSNSDEEKIQKGIKILGNILKKIE